MQVGACGICCDVCFAFKENGGTCWGCYSGLDAPPRKLKQSPCQIIKCASRKKIDYCPKSCEEFACVHYTELPFPYSHKYIQIVTEAIPRANHSHE